MAYIGQNLDRFSNVEKLDVITPSTATGAGPYNLTQNSTAFTPINANSLVISIDGVIQYGNFTVNNATVTFDSALSDSNTCDFIYQMGIGLISTPGDDTVSTVKLAANSVTTAKINNLAVTDAKINTVAASKLTGALPAISGANLTNLPTETKPTVDSISPTVITNAATAVTITGTNFISVPQVEAINSTGAIVAADSITYTSATQVVATFTLPTAAGVAGKEYMIKNMTTNSVTISTTGSEQIWQDAANKTTSASLGADAQNNWIKLVSDGTNWISFRALY